SWYPGSGPASVHPQPQKLRSRAGGPGLIDRASRCSVRTGARAAAAATSTAGTPFTSFGDGELPAPNVVTVHLLDGTLGLRGRAHPDESEATRLSRSSVRDDRGRFAGPGACEEITQLLAGGGKGQVPHEELLAHHHSLSSASGRSLARHRLGG